MDPESCEALSSIAADRFSLDRLFLREGLEHSVRLQTNMDSLTEFWQTVQQYYSWTNNYSLGFYLTTHNKDIKTANIKMSLCVAHHAIYILYATFQHGRSKKVSGVKGLDRSP